MKTLFARLFAAAFVAGCFATAIAQDAGDAPPPPPDTGAMDVPVPASPDTATPADTSGGSSATISEPVKFVGTNGAAKSDTTTVANTAFTPPDRNTDTNSSNLRLNFRNAPLEMVLNYLSDAAGFIIVLDTQVRGNVNVISNHSMTKDEAVDLLNSVLNKNGYAAIRDGRTLTILDRESAKTRDIPVKVSNDPNAIPKNDEIVTQIIPIRFVEASQLVKDLSSFVSSQAVIVANDAGNSIVITDTQANIHHLVEIIKAIDSSAEGETQIRVFHLQHASPTDVANELASIFPSSSGSSSGSQSPIRFGGGFPGPGGFFARMMQGNNGGGNSSSQNSRVQKQSQVTAVADPRTSSVIVTASKDLMQEIAGMMAQLDVASGRDQKVYVFHMNNGDPQQAAQVLQNMFQSSTTSRSSSSSSSQNSALMQREMNNSSSSSSSVNGSSTSTSGGFGSGSSRAGGGGGSLF